MDAQDHAGQEQDWHVVDEGWGRRAVDFATLSEPANCREYVALHQHLDVKVGDRLLDVACGAGLAVELAASRGAVCAGIDASPRLIKIARDRSPQADLRVGDMHAMPWEDGSFDVVTSFRGIWGTTPRALAEVHRVLAPGGRFGLTVWGHIKASPGAWALAPFTLASQPKVAHQAAMVALGRPGVGEELLADAGFVDVERVTIPFAWEFPDPEAYARALVSTGPAFEAIQAVGEDAVYDFAVQSARERIREGLPLRAQIDLAGFLARTPTTTRATTADRWPDAGFLTVPEATADVQRLYDQDVEDLGYVMNASQLWAQLPVAQKTLFDLMGQAVQAGGLTFRQRGVLVTSCAATLGDSYCSLAWGTKLAGVAGAELAGAVLAAVDGALDPEERVLAEWARRVTCDPNGTTLEDVQALRDVGFEDKQVFAITLFVALRMAFSTVNDALGVLPDRALDQTAPGPVREAVSYGRPVGVGGNRD